MHYITTATTNSMPQGAPTVLASLRRLIPSRELRLSEALRIAELQANRLLELRNITDVPVPAEVITGLPRITVEYDSELPEHAASGCSDWDAHRRAWIISLSPTEPETRQKFTLLHEYKHIVDHGSCGIIPSSTYRRAPQEVVADYFAGCVLMPKRLVKAAFYDGIQRLPDLAELFDVSQRALEVRLSQLGLTEPPSPVTTVRRRYPYQARSTRPGSTRYQRALSTTWIPNTTAEVIR